MTNNGALFDLVRPVSAPARRRPRYRAVVPVHKPSLDRDARKALPDDALFCQTCNERVAAVVSGGTCPNCEVRWGL